jgi:hypothetical protein
MIKKILLTCVVLVLLAAAGYGLLYYRWQRITTPHSVAELNGGMAQPDTRVVAGPITDVSVTSITVKKQDGTNATLAVNASTTVISQVASGQTGEGLGDLKVGDMVLVVPVLNNATLAQSINLVPAPTLSTAGVALAYISGTVSAKTASGFTVVEGGASVSVSATSSTVVLSNVEAGQKGKTLDDITVGSLIQVSGTQSGRDVAAQSVTLLIPLTSSAQ